MIQTGQDYGGSFASTEVRLQLLRFNTQLWVLNHNTCVGSLKGEHCLASFPGLFLHV